MQDVNRLKLVLVEQKKGGIHDVDNIVEGTPVNGYPRNLEWVHLQFLNGVPTLHSLILKLLAKISKLLEVGVEELYNKKFMESVSKS